MKQATAKHVLKISHFSLGDMDLAGEETTLNKYIMLKVYLTSVN